MAKARHTFKLSDIQDKDVLRKKYYKIWNCAIMVAIAQLFKFCADHNLAQNAFNEFETDLEQK